MTSYHQRTRARGLYLATCAVLAVLLLADPAAADPNDDRARVDADLVSTRAALEAATDEAEAAAVAYQEANRLLPEVQSKLAEAREVLAAAQQAAQAAVTDANRATSDLTGAEQLFAAAQARVRQTRTQIATFAADAYKGRNLAWVQGMLSIQAPADLVDGLTYLERLAIEQRRMLATHTVAEVDAADRRRVRASRKGAADRSRLLSESKVQVALAAEADATKAEQQVSDLVAQREQALRVAEEQRAANEARLVELQAESDRITADVRVMAAGGGQVLPSGLKLLMPVAGRRTSEFGMRYDPFYRTWQLHAGVDLSAPGGSPIRAAASGQVMRAGWNGGYGNYTCIYHGTYEGKGFATCYAHQSQVLVAVGQQVHQGDVIGRVGTTGASTGNHLHFEVRLDGVPTDPEPWLPG